MIPPAELWAEVSRIYDTAKMSDRELVRRVLQTARDPGSRLHLCFNWSRLIAQLMDDAAVLVETARGAGPGQAEAGRLFDQQRTWSTIASVDRVVLPGRGPVKREAVRVTMGPALEQTYQVDLARATLCAATELDSLVSLVEEGNDEDGSAFFTFTPMVDET